MTDDNYGLMVMKNMQYQSAKDLKGGKGAISVDLLGVLRMRRVQRFASGITAFLFECTPNGKGNGFGMGTGYLILLAIVSDCEMKQNETK